MEESHLAKSGQENDFKDPPQEVNIALKADNFEDKNNLPSDDEVGEQKGTQTENVEVKNTLNLSNPVASEEKNEIRNTNSHEVNGLEKDEQATTKVPKVNHALESGKRDDPLSSNFDEGDDIASSTLAQVERAVHSKETHSELMDSQSKINVSSNNSFESPGVEGGSHRSPDRKSKVEYRKIKSEVTGEGETSESEGEDNNMDTAEKQTSANDNYDQTQDTWMDILGNGLLKKRVLREGKGRDTRPDRGQVVTLQVAGRTEDGIAVDWNRSLEFMLGEGEVIQAFDLVVALMELDEVCELFTDPKYAYGQAGKPDGKPPIPPDAKLTYELQLLAVRDGPNIANMTDEERLVIGEKKREIGNDLYTGGDYAGAINSYQRAIKYLSSSTSEEVQSLRVKCWNNMAAAQLKIKAYSAAEKSCSQVLQVDPNNVKALFRKGKVLAANGETGQALVYIKKADQLDPSNKTIRAELNRLKQLLASEKQSERSMYRRMVGDLTGQVSKKNNRTVFGWPLVFGATVVALGGILMAVYLTRH